MSLGDIRNLDYTILLCSRMQDTKQFYLDVMGFPLFHDTERRVSFQVGSALLTVRPRGPGLAWDDGPIAPGSAAVQLAFRVPPHMVDVCHEAAPAVERRRRGRDVGGTCAARFFGARLRRAADGRVIAPRRN